MKERTRKFLDKALDAIEVAEGILDMNKPEFAAGRAYYAMFYVSRGFTLRKRFGIQFTWAGYWSIRLAFCKDKRT